MENDLNINILNYTPHEITIFLENDEIVIPSDGVATIFHNEIIQNSIFIDGKCVQITKRNFGRIVGLPKSKKNTLFIVSSIVRKNSHRCDLISPSNFVHNKDGKIIGCKNFVR